MESGPGISEISAVIPFAGERTIEIGHIEAYLKSLGFGEVIIATGDRKVMNRYDAALKAKYDVIYTQDDDCIIHNINELINNYKPERIIANIKQGHLSSYKVSTDGRVALVGWGAVFHRNLINFKPYLDKFPEDDLFITEADRVFTWLNEKKLIVADKHIKDFPSAYGGLSMQDDHFDRFYNIIQNLKQL